MPSHGAVQLSFTWVQGQDKFSDDDGGVSQGADWHATLVSHAGTMRRLSSLAGEEDEDEMEDVDEDAAEGQAMRAAAQCHASFAQCRHRRLHGEESEISFHQLTRQGGQPLCYSLLTPDVQSPSSSF